MYHVSSNIFMEFLLKVLRKYRKKYFHVTQDSCQKIKTFFVWKINETLILETLKPFKFIMSMLLVEKVYHFLGLTIVYHFPQFFFICLYFVARIWRILFLSFRIDKKIMEKILPTCFLEDLLCSIVL